MELLSSSDGKRNHQKQRQRGVLWLTNSALSDESESTYWQWASVNRYRRWRTTRPQRLTATADRAPGRGLWSDTESWLQYQLPTWFVSHPRQQKKISDVASFLQVLTAQLNWLSSGICSYFLLTRIISQWIQQWNFAVIVSLNVIENSGDCGARLNPFNPLTLVFLLKVFLLCLIHI